MVDPVARLRRRGQHGWPDAWLWHRRLVTDPLPAIEECARPPGDGGFYSACAAVAWSAPELTDQETELEPVVRMLAETLPAAERGWAAAITLTALASAGFTLAPAQDALCRMATGRHDVQRPASAGSTPAQAQDALCRVATGRHDVHRPASAGSTPAQAQDALCRTATGRHDVQLPARVALKTLAAAGRLLPASGEFLLGSGNEPAADIAETAFWRGMPLTEAAREILTAQLGPRSPAYRVARAQRMSSGGGGDRGRREPVTQAVVDAIAADAAATELGVRIRAVATPYRGARDGANLDAAVTVLSAALADQRRPTKQMLPDLNSTADVSWYAACALGTAVAAGTDRGAILDVLRAGIAQRRRDTRHAAATALGVATAVLGEWEPLAMVLSRDERPLVLSAMVGFREGLRRHPDSAVSVPALVDWLAANDFDPAWCFESETVNRMLGDHLRASTSDGLGGLVDALAGPRRDDALQALAAAARNGTDIAVAIPVIAGTLLCGDWPTVAWKVLDCLSVAARAGAPVISAAPWLADHLVPGGAATAAAATVVEAAISQGTDPAGFTGPLMAVAGQPFARTPPGFSVLGPVRASHTAARTLAGLAAQQVQLDPREVVAW